MKSWGKRWDFKERIKDAKLFRKVKTKLTLKSQVCKAGLRACHRVFSSVILNTGKSIEYVGY